MIKMRLSYENKYIYIKKIILYNTPTNWTNCCMNNIKYKGDSVENISLIKLYIFYIKF